MSRLSPVQMVRSAKLVTMSPDVAVWHGDNYSRKRGSALMLTRTHFGRWYRQNQDCGIL